MISRFLLVLNIFNILSLICFTDLFASIVTFSTLPSICTLSYKHQFVSTLHFLLVQYCVCEHYAGISLHQLYSVSNFSMINYICFILLLLYRRYNISLLLHQKHLQQIHQRFDSTICLYEIEDFW